MRATFKSLEQASFFDLYMAKIEMEKPKQIKRETITQANYEKLFAKRYYY